MASNITENNSTVPIQSRNRQINCIVTQDDTVEHFYCTFANKNCRSFRSQLDRQSGHSSCSSGSKASSAALCSLSSCSTPLSARVIARVRTCAASIFFAARSKLSRVLLKTSPNLPNSVLTAPKTCYTSLARFSSARVLKPLCKLLQIAINVVGPATTTLCSRCKVSSNPA